MQSVPMQDDPASPTHRQASAVQPTAGGPAAPVCLSVHPSHHGVAAQLALALAAYGVPCYLAPEGGAG